MRSGEKKEGGKGRKKEGHNPPKHETTQMNQNSIILNNQVRHIFYDSIFIKCPEKVNLWRQSFEAFLIFDDILLLFLPRN